MNNRKHKETVAIENCDNYRIEAIDAAMNSLMEDLGLDPCNPFQSFIKPGMKVFIKPNWVASR